MRRGLLFTICVTAVALAACGGSEDPPVASVASTTTARPVTTNAPTTTAPTTITSAPATTSTPTTTSIPTTTSAPPTTGALRPGGDNRVFVLGDSALLGARDTVPAALSGWKVTFDAVGSRRLPQGIEVLRARRAEIGPVVVIQMGNNFIAEEGSFALQIDRAMEVLDGVQRVVWLTVAERWPSRVAINADIRAAAQRWPQIAVADWAAAISAHPDYAGDMLHLSGTGRLAIAELIAEAVGPA